MKKIKIEKLAEEIYCKYPNQTNPQPVYIELKPDTGEVSATCNYELGGTPMPVYEGKIRWYAVASTYARKDYLNETMERLEPLFRRVAEGYLGKGELTDDALAAEYEIMSALDWTRYDASVDSLYVWDPREYFQCMLGEIKKFVREARRAGLDPAKELWEEHVDDSTVDIFEPDLDDFCQELEDEDLEGGEKCSRCGEGGTYSETSLDNNLVSRDYGMLFCESCDAELTADEQDPDFDPSFRV